MEQLAIRMKTAAKVFGMNAKFYCLKFSRNERKKELLSGRFADLGDGRLAAGKTGKAKAAYGKALLLNENPGARLSLGNACLEERHFSEARRHFEKVAVSEKADLKEKLGAYMGIKRSYDKEGMIDDAVETCIRAGTEILSQNDMNTIMPAKNYFDTAVRLRPNLAEAYYGRALCELYIYDLARSMGYGQGEIKNALFDLHQALKFWKEAEHIDKRLASTILEYSRTQHIYDSKNLRKAAQAIIEKFEQA